MILRQLLRQPGWVSSQELADRLGLSRRALTYALGEVDELLEAGYSTDEIEEELYDMAPWR